jgi:hypothetical protein
MPFHPDDFPPVHLEENPDRSAIASSVYDWPEELVAHLEAEVAAMRAAKAPTCPLCGSPAYICDETHTDGSGPTLHCRAASMHNFPVKGGDAA